MSNPIIIDRTMELSATVRPLVLKAITRHEGWDAYRKARGINAAGLSTKEALFDALEALQIDPLPYVQGIVAEETERMPRTPRPIHNDVTGDAEELARVLARVLAAPKGVEMDEDKIIELIRQHAGRPATSVVEFVTQTEVRKFEGLNHHRFPALLAAVAANVNILIVGPAGSGKTKAAENTAKALGLEFYFTGAIDSAYKLSGFIDAQGRPVHTAFRKAFEHGGVFLFDEIDASLPGAVLAFNAALANDYADFPDGVVARHPNFRAIASANTFGRGADRQYVGRVQQDAAALDRFAVLEWDYCITLEAGLAGVSVPENAPRLYVPQPIQSEETFNRERDRWFQRVQEVRRAVEKHKVRHVVSPRATVAGLKLLKAGWDWGLVEEAVLWKGLDKDARQKIAA